VNLTRVRDVVDNDGPFTTLHVEVGRASENPAEQIQARWTSIRHRLEADRVDPGLVSDLESRVVEPVHLPGEVRRTIVAAGDRVVLDEVQVGHNPRPESLDRDVLPDLSAWLAVADREMPFVLVIADREGADLEVHRATSRGDVETRTVTGDTYYVTKVAEGDWAQKQFQQTAENTWHHNARLVADEVRSLVRRHAPEVVLVAGEERARHEVLHALEEDGAIEARTTVVPVEAGGRAEGASRDAMWQEVHARLAEIEGNRDGDLAGQLDQARGRGDGGATGLQDVLSALAQSRVGLLALDLDAMREHTVRPGDHSGLPVPRSAAGAEELPADRVLVAAAALSGAELAVLPEALTHGGGVAALLRWTTPTD
jgi:hypothetical protein